MYVSLCVFQGVDAHGSSLPVCMCALCGVCCGVCAYFCSASVCVCVLNISRRAPVFVCLSLLMSMLVGLRVPICMFSKIVLCLHARKVLLHRAESSAHLYLLFLTVSKSWASILKLTIIPSGLELEVLLPHPPEQLRSQTSAWDGRSAPFCTCQGPKFRALSSVLLSAGP